MGVVFFKTRSSLTYSAQRREAEESTLQANMQAACGGSSSCQRDDGDEEWRASSCCGLGQGMERGRSLFVDGTDQDDCSSSLSLSAMHTN